MRAFAGSTECKGRTANLTWLSLFKGSALMLDEGRCHFGRDGGAPHTGSGKFYTAASWPCEILS